MYDLDGVYDGWVEIDWSNPQTPIFTWNKFRDWSVYDLNNYGLDEVGLTLTHCQYFPN